jgi:hypothetical protein
MVAGNTERNPWQDYDPLFRDMYAKIGPSIFLRTFARMHEAAKYYEMTRQWLDQVDLHDRVLHQAGRAPSRARASARPRPLAVRCRTGS